MSRLVALRSSFIRLWGGSRPLTAVGLTMLPVLAFSLAGLWLDPRLVVGAPAWLKPAKFAASIAIYSFTLAWVFSLLPEHPRTRRVVGRLSAFVMLLEMAIIALQAARGRPSHFNVSTPLDAVLFSVMGAAIALQTLTSVAVAVALWRQRFADGALGWALRLGMVITIAGASLAGIMTTPRQEQLAALEAGQHSAVGAHTVGAADGGPGLPVTGWSREHGDVRAPHFMGLHAIQVLPLLALGLGRRRVPETRRVRVVLVAAASYASLLALLLWQALRGQSLVAPDGATLAALVAWLALTAIAAGLVLARRNGAARAPAAVA